MSPLDVSERFFGPEVSPTAELLERVAAFIARYLILGESERLAVALWVLHTHVVDAAEVSPYLAVMSPEKRSGKTTLLKLLALLCQDAWRVITPTEAVLYRKIERDRPTLLLDEIETVFGPGRENEPLRALLNAGNEPGTVVPRCGGANRDRLDEFRVYCAKALAGIGEPLPDTILDRSILIGMKRKAQGEPIERFRRRDAADDAEPLHIDLREWAELELDRLCEIRPPIPDALDDRAADVWEPLFAIADLAGGDLPSLARCAALELSSGEAREDDSIGVQLLAAIKTVFTEQGIDRISTADLINALCDDPEAPWSTWLRGQRISARALASRLRHYGIRSRSIRLDDGRTPKGYLIHQFEDSWGRYIVHNVVLQPHPPQWFNHAPLTGLGDPPQHSVVADDEEATNPHAKRDVADVAAETANEGNDWVPESDASELDLERRSPVVAAASPGSQGFLTFIRDRYRAGCITRREWLARVGLHSQIIGSHGGAVAP